jgi:hypothetical protein
LYPVIHATPASARWATPFKAHPEGGFEPVNAEDRGELDAACWNCGAVVARGFTPKALARSMLRCAACDQRSVGEDYPHRAM